MRDALDGRGAERFAVAAALAQEWAELQAFWHPRPVVRDEASIDDLKARLQRTMWDNAGPLRTAEKLERALADVRALAAESADIALAPRVSSIVPARAGPSRNAR